MLSDGHGHSFTATNSTTSVNVLGWTLSGLTINTANVSGNDEANFTLQLTAIERDADGNTSSTIASEKVTVTPNSPSISASPATGVEGSPIALHISASGDDPGKSLASLVVGAIPIGDTLSDGQGHSFMASADQTSVDVHTWHLSSLTITPTSTIDFTLTVTATVQDFEGDVGPSATTTEHVTVTAPPPVITGTTAVASPSPADDSGESLPDDPSATGTVKFADTDTTNSFQASFSADGHGYQGTFTLGAVSQANGSGSVAWSFTGPDFGTTPLDQSYDITISDSFGSQVKETVSVIAGTTGNNTLTAHTGVNVLFGGGGSDTLVANHSGAGGNDTFVFLPNIGQETVQNFQSGADKLDISQIPGVDAANISSWLNSHAASVNGNHDTLIDLLASDPTATHHSNETILLKSIALSNLHASDFIVHA